MAEVIAESKRVRLFRRDMEQWSVYRLEADEEPGHQELTPILEALSRSADELNRPVCIVLEDLKRPNSRMLAALVSLLTAKDGKERRVALAGACRGWLDMLDILGVGSRFLIVGSPEDLTPE